MALFGRKIRSRRLRASRRRYATRFLLLSGGILLSFLVLFSQVSRIPSLLVTEIGISGNDALTEESIKEVVEEQMAGTYLLLAPRNNIFLLPKKSITASLHSLYDRIEDVSFKRDGLKKINIEIDERSPFGMWCETLESEECFFLDRNGIIFSKAPSFTGMPFFVYVGEILGEPLGNRFLEHQEFVRLNLFLQELAGLGIEIDSYVVSTDGVSNEVYMKAGGSIRFNAGDPYENIVKDLSAILDSDALGPDLEEALMELDYIDFRFGNKVYRKFK